MTAPDLTGCDLPDGTVILMSDDHADLAYAWTTSEGLHIVHSHISASHLTPPGHPAFVEAARTFQLAIALEVLAGFARDAV